ncbi:hypothetical protein M9H77_26540 [Catharanthus roseus]|uniref:Uncharacterized protein n=1 Tax=Catharanthus roseus TaxID=4058 RepID=A0ACC0A9Y8_CATRO|nr:hypothetical protein M9H77_26540 [Catharanthus roseus]
MTRDDDDWRLLRCLLAAPLASAAPSCYCCCCGAGRAALALHFPPLFRGDFTMDKYFEKWKKDSKTVEETSSNKGNVNNENRGKKPRVRVEIGKPIDSYPYAIRGELRRRSYWISSSDRAHRLSEDSDEDSQL